MKLYIARHGETDWNLEKRIQGSTDIELNQNGISQAVKLGNSLKEENAKISKIYTSSQKRAVLTGEKVSEILNVPMEIIPGIQEMNLGKWEGCTWKQVAEMFSDEYQVWYSSRRYTRTPEGESYQDVAVRVFVQLEDIIKQNAGDVLIITHGAIVLTILAILNDVPFEQMTKVFKVDNASPICIESEEIFAAMKKIKENYENTDQ